MKPQSIRLPLTKRAVRAFWRRVDQSGFDCWLWTGRVAVTGYPYGCIKVRDLNTYAHRVSWVIHFGKIPDGLCVLHHCDNPRCVNPSHLFVGTQKDNTADAIAKGRKAYPTGFKLSREDARVIYQRAASGEPLIKIARDYGVSRYSVHYIKTGRNWAAATEDLRP